MRELIEKTYNNRVDVAAWLCGVLAAQEAHISGFFDPKKVSNDPDFKKGFEEYLSAKESLEK